MDAMTLMFGSAAAWTSMLVETTVRVSVVLLVAMLVAMGLRRSGANLRHLVWATALAGALALPVLAGLLPEVAVPLPGLAARGPAVVGGPGPSPTESTADRAAALSAAAPARNRFGTAAPSPRLDDADQAATAPAPRTGPRPGGSPRTATPIAWPGVAVGLWAIGVLALGLRIVCGMAATWRLGRRAGPPADPEWTRLADVLRRRLGVGRPVRILGSRTASVPMTWGWRRPVVLVPEGGGWSTERKRVVLLHELSHVRRHDCASQLLAQVVCALHWFNPLAWLGARSLRIERERACDDAVVRAGTQPSSYADHLLDIARRQPAGRWTATAAVAMARPSQLEGRLLSILAPGIRRPPTRGLVAGLATVMVALVGAMAVVTPAAAGAQTGGGAPLPQPVPPVPVAAPAAPVEPAPQTRGPAERQAALEAVRRQEEAERESLEQDRLAQERALAEVEAEARELEAVVRDRIQRAELGLAAARQQRAELEASQAEPALREAFAVARRAAEEMQRQIERDLELVDTVRLTLAIPGRDREPLDPRVASLLLESLTDPDAEVRERAAWGLGRNGVSEAAEPLGRALGDESAEVRARAAWALGRIRAESAVGPLTAALDDPEQEVVEEVVQALGLIRAESAINALAGVLDHPDVGVRVAVAQALGRMRSAEAVGALGRALDDEAVPVRVQAVEALGRIRDRAALEPLMGALSDTEPPIREEAAEALGRLGDAAAVDRLAATLQDSDPDVAEQAAEALGRIGDPGGVDPLVGALGHTDPDVVEASAEALGRIGSPDAVDGLVAALAGASGDVAEELIEALGRIGGDQALEALIGATGDASPEVRLAVIEALGGRRWVSDPDPDPDPSVNPNPNPNSNPNR